MAHGHGVEPLFSSQGIFDDVRTLDVGEPFSASKGLDLDFKAKRKSIASKRLKSDVLQSAGFGLSLGSQDTGSTKTFSLDNIIKVLGGAGTGALVGGPLGALAGGLSAGLSSFLTSRGAKKKKKATAAKEARYQKMLKEQIAREDKFAKQERDDRLDIQGYNRRQDKLNSRYRAYKDFSSQMTSLINNDAALKEQFAKGGF